MSKNIGKIIKVFAIILQLIFVIGSIATLATSIVTGTNVFGFNVLGMTGMACGALISVAILITGFVIGLSLYGYGEMICTLKSLNGEDGESEEEDEDEEYDEDDEGDDFDL